MDPLSDIIALLRPRAAVSKPISGKGRWAVHYDAHDAPGFTIILSGEAWLTFAVVGAGPTGVELAGQIAELARDTLRRDYRSIDTGTSSYSASRASSV